MGVEVIYCTCPRCGKSCKAKPIDYEPSLGRFYCENCDILGSVSMGDDDEEVEDDEEVG